MAEDRPAEHEGMRAPAVIGPVAVRGERASEIGRGEDRDVVLQAHLPEPAVERVHRGVRGRQLLAVLAEKEVVVVEAAEGDQEHLTVRPESAARGDDAGDDIELRGEVARGDEPSGVDRKSTRLNSSHSSISYAVFCLKKKKK